MGSWSSMTSEQSGAAQACKNAGFIRGCLSRAYYAVYAAATNELLRSGIDVRSGDRPNPGHEQLIELVRHNLSRRKFSDDDRRKLARDIRRLWSFRVSADYDPESDFEVQDALIALQKSQEVQRRLEGARQV